MIDVEVFDGNESEFEDLFKKYWTVKVTQNDDQLIFSVLNSFDYLNLVCIFKDFCVLYDEKNICSRTISVENILKVK